MQILKEEVRTQILQSAENSFCENGFQATTMRCIAKEIGISVSNLYLYYENKEMLFNAVADPIFHFYIYNFTDFLNHKDEKDELNQKMSLAIGNMILSNKDRFLLLFEKSKGTKYECFRDEIITRMQMHIVKQMSEEVLDKELLAKLFAQNLMEGIVYIIKTQKDKRKLEQDLQYLADFYTKGIIQFLK